MNFAPLWVIIIGSLLAGATALLSVWNFLAPELWWQALLSLAVIMMTMWTAAGAMRMMRGESSAHWIPLEAAWSLVGIALLYVMVLAAYAAPVEYDPYLTGDLLLPEDQFLVDEPVSDTTP